MRAFLRPLYRPRTQGFWLYVSLAASVSAAGSVALLSVINHLTDWLAPDVEGPSVEAGWIDFFVVVVFSPAVETALLLLTLRLVQKTNFSAGTSAAAAAIIWGGLHAIVYPVWFFGTVWSFFVFSCAALAWRNKSRKHAYWAAALPHALVNAAAFGVLAFSAGA